MVSRSRATRHTKNAESRRRTAAAAAPSRAPAGAAPRARWRAVTLLTLAAAALVPLLVYWPTTGYGFLLDDLVYFQKSPSLSDLASIPRGFVTNLGALRKGVDTVIISYYRPVFLALSTLYYQLA